MCVLAQSFYIGDDVQSKQKRKEKRFLLHESIEHHHHHQTKHHMNNIKNHGWLLCKLCVYICLIYINVLFGQKRGKKQLNKKLKTIFFSTINCYCWSSFFWWGLYCQYVCAEYGSNPVFFCCCLTTLIRLMITQTHTNILTG